MTERDIKILKDLKIKHVRQFLPGVTRNEFKFIRHVIEEDVLKRPDDFQSWAYALQYVLKNLAEETERQTLEDRRTILINVLLLPDDAIDFFDL